VALQRNSKHFHEALVRLVGPMWGRPRIAALLQSYINEVQGVEDAAWSIIESRHVNSATGVHLDTLGKLVGVPRFTSDDDTYRNVVRAKIAANRSNGTTDALITVVRLAGDVTSPVLVSHPGPATVRVELSEEVDDAGFAALVFILPRARAAGVRLVLVRPPAGGGLLAASSVSGGGGDLASSISGGGDGAFSARTL
jgi:hypothetical protein